MKIQIKKANKLISFLIKALERTLNTGVKTLETIQKLADKAAKLAPILVGISQLLVKLDGYQKQINELAEEKE